ncbi:MAG: VOC family protein [Dehalococcoidia bacterium]|nr:VOC family protein [Dehalococcoidia bacterium]
MEEKKPARARLGKLSHVGIVVRDMDKALDYYTGVLGLGPFTTEVYDLQSFVYRGKRASARVKAAISNSGPVFVELVQVLEGETVHTEFLREKGEGLQHVAFLVRNLDEKLKDLAHSGIHPAMRLCIPIDTPADQPGTSKKNRMELTEVYLDSDKIGGTMIQLMEFREVPVTQPD